MTYSEFFVFLKKWRDAKRYPPVTAWPEQINLDMKGWEGVEKLNYLTSMDGREYESSFFFIEGETFITTPLRGTQTEVKANHSLKVKYQIAPKKQVYYRSVLLDDKLISNTAVKPQDLPKKTQLGFLFNVHSHPEHVNSNGEKTYSFFSDTDIRSLISSDAMITGLVTNSFWVACKTDQVISRVGEVGEELLREISERSFAGESYLDIIIRENMARWGLIFYHGTFGKPLVRVN
jgi:hypothetical protein